LSYTGIRNNKYIKFSKLKKKPKLWRLSYP